MSEDKLRSKTRLLIWLAIGITLVPLVPYALRGSNDQVPAQVIQQGEVQQGAVSPAPTSAPSY